MKTGRTTHRSIAGRFGAVIGVTVSLAFMGASVVATPALAADFPASPYYTAPQAYSAYSWAGPYVGGTLGYEWGDVSNNPTRPSGVEMPE